jgi:hypothetical protein
MKTTGFSIFCIMLFMLILAAPPALAAIQWQTTTIPLNGLAPIAADISGDTIAFTAATGDPVNQSTPRVVCLYSITTGNLSTITRSVLPMSLTGAQISGPTLVWFEQPAWIPNVTGGPDRILLATIPENTPQVIHTGDGAEWPKVSGKQVIWSGDVNGSEYIQGIYLYDITTGTVAALPGLTVLDAAATIIDGKTIAYQDGLSMDLVLYDTETGNRTVVAREVRTDASATNIDSFAFSGNNLLFITRTIGLEKDDRGESRALFLYTLDDTTTRLISPATGAFVTTLTNEEKTATFDSPFTDGTRVGWVQVTGIGRSAVMILDPVSEEISVLPVDSFVAFPSMDSSKIVFTTEEFGTNSSLVLATENTGESPEPRSPAPTGAPGFSSLIVVAACSVAGIVPVIRRK